MFRKISVFQHNSDITEWEAFFPRRLKKNVIRFFEKYTRVFNNTHTR
jgi:hypothetical protein